MTVWLYFLHCLRHCQLCSRCCERNCFQKVSSMHIFCQKVFGKLKNTIAVSPERCCIRTLSWWQNLQFMPGKTKKKQKPNQQTNKHGGAVCWVNQTGMSLMCPFLFICVLLICVCGICISEGCALASFRCRRVFGECGKFSCVLPPALWLCHRHLHQCSSSCAFHGVIVDYFTAVIFSIMRQPRQTACEDLITRLFSSGVIKGSSNVFGWL